MLSISTRTTLNHLSFPSNDVGATASFFERQWGCSVTAVGSGRFAKRPGFDLVIEDAADQTVEWPRNSYPGLELETLEALRDTDVRFKESGGGDEQRSFSSPTRFEVLLRGVWRTLGRDQHAMRCKPRVSQDG